MQSTKRWLQCRLLLARVVVDLLGSLIPLGTCCWRRERGPVESAVREVSVDAVYNAAVYNNRACLRVVRHNYDFRLERRGEFRKSCGKASPYFGWGGAFGSLCDCGARGNRMYRDRSAGL